MSDCLFRNRTLIAVLHLAWMVIAIAFGEMGSAKLVTLFFIYLADSAVWWIVVGVNLRRSLIGQAAVVYGFLALFTFSAILSPTTNIDLALRSFTAMAITSTGFVLLLSMYLDRRGAGMPFHVYRRPSLGLLAVLLITILPRLPMLGTLQRWDAGEYYYRLGTACQQFRFTLWDLVQGFCLANHTTTGFSLLMSIGEFLNPRGQTGTLVVNLVLTVMAVLSVRRILTDCCPSKSNHFADFSTALFSLTPFFLGSFGYLSPDYVGAVMFLIALGCERRSWYLLQFLALALAANCKETMLIPITFYLFAHLAFGLIGPEPALAKIRRVLRSGVTVATIAALVTLLIVLIKRGGFVWRGGGDANVLRVTSDAVNSFALSPSYALFRIKQCFVLDFAWITTLATVAGSLFMAKKKRAGKRFDFKRMRAAATIAAPALSILLFNALFLTAGAYRYVDLFIFLYPVVASLLIYEGLGCAVTSLGGAAFSGLVGLALLVESFIHIDFVSAAVFPTASTGTWYTVLTNYTHESYGNDLCNNYQYSWVDRSLDAMLYANGYDGTDVLIYVGRQYQGLQVEGNGDVYRLCWDMSQGRRVMYDDWMQGNPDLVTIKTIRSAQLEQMQPSDMPESALVFFVPYYESDVAADLDALSNWYEIGPRQCYPTLGGEITCYELTRR